MSEQVRNNESPSNVLLDLRSLIDTLWPFYDPDEKTILLTELAHRLSRMVDKSPAWGWRYIQGVVTGYLKPSPKLLIAIRDLSARSAALASIQELVPRTVQVNSLAKVRPGSFILSPSQPCRNPACSIHFVPRVPWQKDCPCCQKKKRK